MSITVEEVLDLVDMEAWMDYAGVDSTSGMCHNACCWLMVQIKKAGLSEYNIAWCVGTFWDKDHSWLLLQDPDSGDETIVDMTVNQFVEREVPWVGPMNDQYKVYDSALLCDPEKLVELVNMTGCQL